MRIKYLLLISAGIVILLATTVPANGLEIQGEFRSRLEVSPGEKTEIPALKNQLNLELSQYSTTTGLLKGTFQYDSSNIDLLEIYSEMYFSSTDLTIGKQRIAWGRADGINPTDYFNPEDLSKTFAEDNKINIPAVRAKNYYQDWVFDLVWSPVFAGNKLPEPGDRWYPERELKLPPGYEQLVKETIEPEKSVENSQFGLRFSRWSGSVDMSFSYYYGWRKEPTIYTTVDESNDQIIIQPEYNRLQGIGADFARPSGKYMLRGETAYFITADKDLKDDYLQYILGVDFDASDDLYINIHFFGEKERGREPENGIFLAMEYSINDFNRLELNTIYRFKHEEFIINPVYVSDLMDGVNLSTGAYLIDGDEVGEIGQFSARDYMYIEFSRVF